MGFFYRTLRMIDYGIKPMYVFDGKPPDLKAKVLAGRYGRREEAREEEEEEKDVGVYRFFGRQRNACYDESGADPTMFYRSD